MTGKIFITTITIILMLGKVDATEPSTAPFSPPSSQPSLQPTSQPSLDESSSPSSTQPINNPSLSPTTSPTTSPTRTPISTTTPTPTDLPTVTPTVLSSSPSVSPTESPTNDSSIYPTASPTASPSNVLSSLPTTVPSLVPTSKPSELPSSTPTTELQSPSPTTAPTAIPTLLPTSLPTGSSTVSQEPSALPTKKADPPTPYPTVPPSSYPTPKPTFQCIKPYKGRGLTTNVGGQISEEIELPGAAIVCFLIRFAGYPSTSGDIKLTTSGSIKGKSGINNKCKYIDNFSVQAETEIEFCGPGAGLGGGISNSYSKQGCISCDDPPEYDCNLDPDPDNLLSFPIPRGDLGDGCDELKNKIDGKGKVFQNFDFSRTKYVKKIQKLLGDLFEVSASIQISVTLGGELETTEKDGDSCGDEQCTCEESTKLTGYVEGSISGSGGVSIKGWAGLQLTVTGSVKHSISGECTKACDSQASKCCFEYKIEYKVSLTVKGKIRIFWGLSYSGTIVTASCTATITANSCTGVGFPKIKCKLDWLEPDDRLRRQLLLTENNSRYLRKYGNISDADLNNFTVDDILWNPDPPTCDQMGYECGGFYIGDNEYRNCGTCSGFSLCLSKEVEKPGPVERKNKYGKECVNVTRGDGSDIIPSPIVFVDPDDYEIQPSYNISSHPFKVSLRNDDCSSDIDPVDVLILTDNRIEFIPTSASHGALELYIGVNTTTVNSSSVWSGGNITFCAIVSLYDDTGLTQLRSTKSHTIDVAIEI